MTTLFPKEQVAGAFRGFSEGGLEFHADLVLPYRSAYQSSPMHGQFVLVQLEHDREAVLGRITTISAQGRLVSPSGEDYAVRAVHEDRPISEELRDQYLRYRVDIRILGVVRLEGDKVLFVPSHRRLPHVGSKVAFIAGDLLAELAGANDSGPGTAELGFLAFGEFVHSGTDRRVGNEPWLVVREPAIVPRFDVRHLVSRRSFVFARAGFGKSNLIKLLLADLYSAAGGPPTVEKRGGRQVPVGTVVFDPDGEYFWPDDKGRPSLCDVEGLEDTLVVFTDRAAPSPVYGSFVLDGVRLDIRELQPSKVLQIVLPAERQEQQNVAKLKGLPREKWRRLVDAVHRDGHATDLAVIYDALGLKGDGSQDAEALAARANMVRAVTSLHDPSSQLLSLLLRALSEGKLCIVDISRMRGSQGLALAGVLLQHIFEHNQDQFTEAEPRTIPTIAVIEEAQSVLGGNAMQGDSPFVAWVKEGRKYDLGAILVTQQPGSLSSDLLSQGDNWFVFHLLSSGDLTALKRANAHFSDDLLSGLLNEPLPGHGIFWSSAGQRQYPIPVRVLLFNDAHDRRDPDYTMGGIVNYASNLRGHFEAAVQEAVSAVGGSAPADSSVGTVDVSQTLRAAAFMRLKQRPEFDTKLQTDVGLPWRQVQEWLRELAPETIADAQQWAFELVPPAMTDAYGPQDTGWMTYRRPRADDPTRATTYLKAIRPLNRETPKSEEGLF